MSIVTYWISQLALAQHRSVLALSMLRTAGVFRSRWVTIKRVAIGQSLDEVDTSMEITR